MKRRLLNLAAAMSLALGVATLVLWPLNRFREIVWAGYHVRASGSIDSEWTLCSLRGIIDWRYTSYGRDPAWAGHWSGIGKPGTSFSRHIAGGKTISYFYYAGGFYWLHESNPLGLADDRELAIPNWFLAGVFFILPLYWWLMRYWWLTHRRVRAGCCPACGYDLRATPDRCPECGTPAAGSSNPVPCTPPRD